MPSVDKAWSEGIEARQEQERKAIVEKRQAERKPKAGAKKAPAKAKAKKVKDA